jgi:hypothetical protein
VNTIYWLSILGMVVCYGLYIRSCWYAYNTYTTYEALPNIVKLAIDMEGGVWKMIEHKWLIAGIAATIVHVTL